MIPHGAVCEVCRTWGMTLCRFSISISGQFKLVRAEMQMQGCAEQDATDRVFPKGAQNVMRPVDCGLRMRATQRQAPRPSQGRLLGDSRGCSRCRSRTKCMQRVVGCFTWTFASPIRCRVIRGAARARPHKTLQFAVTSPLEGRNPPQRKGFHQGFGSRPM